MKNKKGEIKPKISIIVPVYNVQGYLGKCLKSLLAQTLKDIEIICINDGSTDDSLTILNFFAFKDKRIKVIDQENSGPGIARNNGMQAANGEYIGFVDPDDWVKEDMYEKMYNQAKNLDSDIVICDYVKYQEWTGKLWKPDFFLYAINYTQDNPISMAPNQQVIYEKLLSTLLISPCYSWNRLYKASFLKNNNIHFSDKKCYEDCIFILKSHILTHRISYIAYNGYYYLLRKTSILRSFNKRYYDLFDAIECMTKFLQKQNLLQQLDLNLHYFKVMNCVWTYNNLPESERKEFVSYVKQRFSAKEYHAFSKYLKIRIKDKFKNFLGKYISISKQPRHYVIKIFKLKIKIKRRCGRLGAEQCYINLVRKNYKKYPKDTYLLFDCLHDVSVEAIDAYSLFEKMREKGIPAYYVVRKQTALYQKLVAENKLDNVIVLNFSTRTHPNEFMQKIHPILYRTKCILTSFGENSGTVDLFFKRHPSWKYVFLQHGTIFMKESVLYNGYLYPEKFDKFLVCSDREENLFKKYDFPAEKLIKVGLPRWDLLKKLPKPKEKSILLMLTWRRMQPFQFEQSLYKQNLLKLIHNAKLKEYLKQNNISFYFAPHHAILGNTGINFNIVDDNIKIIEQGAVSKYIRQCSCLITDLSSVAFDFMFQYKPVVFYILDRGDPVLGRFDAMDLKRFHYKRFILPNVFFDEDAVVNRIIEYCENNFKIDERTRKIYDSFFYTKENIREQLIEKLENLCPNQ